MLRNRSQPPLASPTSLTPPQDQEHESRERGYFADLARVLPQAVEPFEAVTLHPERRAADAAGEDVEAATHAHRDRHPQPAHPAPDPFLLPRDPHGDEQELRPRLPD